ncbi:sialate O-acetylesterase [Arcticibacterium luteifluviistationis]|uniref:9-O-acetylesterase n=1 Tax=Arcticibacterium luteifluviistationis TaxID=1784714 RepID=A0A2Z4G8Z2_9BACT|nr:sialate O-acetylesterase [Arcticibacterium luteifluviistationis]AWV97661.1 9-O-acetylesterase [Arcticibacterium luteifluviistationis]
MKKHLQLVLLVLFLYPQFVFADVKLNALFTDHMVIQRETKIPIWGWADAGEKVTVKGSWGKKASTVADKNGAWKLTLKTPKAGGPYQITVSGKNKILIDDVLSGEVWLCTGQSNMDFALEKFLNNAKDPKHQPLVEYVRNEVAQANDNQIRHIEVLQNTSVYEKQTDFSGKWVSAKGEDVKKISATGYFFAKELRQHLNVPIGLVECSWGGTRIQPWISEEAFLADQNLREYFLASRKETENSIENWESQAKPTGNKKPKVHPLKDMQVPATLYNGMLNAVIPYGIKGAIWYQGESNAVNMPNDYETMFTTMINSWRADWNQGDFPFYWAQLAACKRGNDKADKGWATVNDKLRRTLKLPNTGMAVLYDIGEPRDIHPHNKMDAGKRLALWALQQDYNIKVAAVSGPLYKTKTIDGNKIEIEFTEVGAGLMVGYKNLMDPAIPVNEPLKWFEIAGVDGVWKSAEAKINAFNKIEVWNVSVLKPINVRYAWSGNPEGANLYNKEGLPAAVFSTEP